MTKNILDFFKKIDQKPRKEQTETLLEVSEYWDNVNYFGLSLPTGCGKTYIAAAIADQCKSAYILTSTIQLQQQYEESWDEIVNLKGRSNYTCGLNPNFTVDAAPCIVKKELVQSCCSKGICPYYKQKQLALSSKAMITNPVYLLLSTFGGVTDEGFGKRDVLIIDEAHNIESHLVSFGESIIDPAKLEKLFEIDFSDCVFTYDNEKNYGIVKTIYERLKIRLEEFKQELTGSFADSKGDADLQVWAKLFNSLAADKVKTLNKKIYLMERYVQPLNIFYTTHTPEDLKSKWIMHKHEEKNTLTLTPLTGGFLFKQFFGKLADKFVFLSATLGTKDTFCAELGIDENDCLWIEKDSPFPTENSPIAILPSISLSKDNYDKNIKNLGKIIDQILDEHPTQRGIIHSVNYNISAAIYLGVSPKNQKRLRCRDMDNLSSGMNGRTYKNSELLEMHTNKSNSVLLSPSMMEGVDLYDDLSVFQIIVKMPWPNLGDIRTKTKMNLDSDWYSNRAWIAIVQGCGRSTRHMDDKSITYILDSKFEYFWKKWKNKLPKYFNDRLCSL